MKNRKTGKQIFCCLMVGVMISLSGCLVPQNVSEVVSGDVNQSEQQAETLEQSQVEHISQDKYAYGVLDEETKQVYDEMLHTILNFDESIELSTVEKEVMETAYQAMMSDYGELFWTSGYSYMEYTDTDDNIVKLEFKPKYTMSRETKEEYETQVEQKAEVYLSECSMLETDYDKVKFIFESLIDSVSYVEGSQENQNILSVFLYGETVCQGYACATQYLLSRLDIPCIVVTGEANGVAHAWNLVYMDGNYYYVDTTWGNSSYSMETDENGAYTNYAYFGATTEQISQTHTAQMKFELPECTAVEDNYFVHEGLYFDSWDADAMGAVMGNAYSDGQGDCSLQFATAELYEQALQYFVYEQKIVNYCNGISTIRYIENPAMNVITFEF